MQHLQPNTTLQGGKYRIERVLGQGGFGIIRSLIFLLLMFVPSLLMAQAIDGQITRKKTTTTNTITNKRTRSSIASKQSSSSKRYSKPAPDSPESFSRMSQEKKNQIVQNLIDNFVYVKGGAFKKGTSKPQRDMADTGEEPIHQVSLSPFYIGKYEVTQEEWYAVMGNIPSKHIGAKLPVENVSWDDCQEFIIKLNTMTGMSFRLPTDAEWEYAACGGYELAKYNFLDIGDVGWFLGNSHHQTHQVGSKKSNILGLYDMLGNVWEWCQDFFSIYGRTNNKDFMGNPTDSMRIIRGGCMNNSLSLCRISIRRKSFPSERGGNIGFRLAR